MRTPTCYHCGSSINDWSGVVMVDSQSYFGVNREVLWLRSYCAKCVKYLDEHEKGESHLHHIWMLSSVKTDSLRYLASALKDNLNGESSYLHWHPQAVTDLINLAILALPANLSIQMLQGFSDWNLESGLADQLRNEMLSR